MTALWRPPLQEAAEKLEQGSSPERREIFRAPAGLAFPCPGWAAQGAGGHRDQLPSPLSWGMAGHRWHRGTHSARAEHRNPAPGLDGRFETGCGDGADNQAAKIDVTGKLASLEEKKEDGEDVSRNREDRGDREDVSRSRGFKSDCREN